MVRKKCEWFPGSMHHITTRGNRRSDIFKDEDDYIIYLAILKEVKIKLPFELYCYCLMTNHVHLQIKTIDISISKIMKRFNQIYAQYFNKKYNYIGHLFQYRYHAEIIKDNSQMLTTTRYIHLNPVRAKMVVKLEEYEYSSYNMYIGMKEEKLIYSENVLSFFQCEHNRKLYQDFVESGIKSNQAIE
ncbi:MAG: transposase [Clostridiaceae bacterium]